MRYTHCGRAPGPAVRSSILPLCRDTLTSARVSAALRTIAFSLSLRTLATDAVLSLPPTTTGLTSGDTMRTRYGRKSEATCSGLRKERMRVAGSCDCIACRVARLTFGLVGLIIGTRTGEGDRRLLVFSVSPHLLS